MLGGEENHPSRMEIAQGNVFQNIKPGTVVFADICPGSCVFGIAPECNKKSGTYIAGHLPAGEIVRELLSMAKIGGGNVTVYQSSVNGEIESLYQNGHKLSPAEVRKLFSMRDLTVF